MDGRRIEALIGVAEAMAEAARGPALRWFRSAGLSAEDKSGAGARFDPVTAADREAEAAMRAVLARLRPDDAILGEEEAATPGTTGLSWTIDPIDGTRAFLCGAPVFTVLIALHDGSRPILGLIDQPFTGERLIGAPGRAEWRRGAESRPLAVRRGRRLDEAILLSTFPEIGTAAERAGFEAVRDRVRLTRYGLDAYGYALLALGQVDLVIEAGLQPYDVQAPIAVIEAAGGLVTDWRGGPADGGGRVLAAGDPALHAAALRLLAPFA